MNLDDLYPDAKKLVLTAGYANTTLLQRNFRIGYARAVNLIDLLEHNGIVEPAESGLRSRKIIPPAKSGDLFA
jgi:S-DNA-T family DNA segregation ATPase FtsK/SpoIIIE